jgi:hypothetical protein
LIGRGQHLSIRDVQCFFEELTVILATVWGFQKLGREERKRAIQKSDMERFDFKKLPIWKIKNGIRF